MSTPFQSRTLLERAFDLARSGKVRSVSDIRLTLKREGYSEHELQGASLLAQLRQLIQDKNSVR